MINMAVPKKGSGRKPDPDKKRPNRTGRTLGLVINPDLRVALELAIKRTRRTLTAEVEVALEEHLKTMGLWPLPPGGQEDGAK